MKCICGNEHTEIKTALENIKIKGENYQYETTFSYCPKCGEEWYTAEQSKTDDKAFSEVKWRAFGYLTPKELKAIREKHGLTVEKAAEIFFCRIEDWLEYEDGQRFQPQSLDRMIRYFDAAPEAAKQINESSQYIFIPPREKRLLIS